MTEDIGNHGPAVSSGTDRRPNGGPHFMFGRAGLAVLAGMMIAAVWFGFMGLVLLTGIMMAVAVTAKIWSRLSLTRVTYVRRLGSRRAFPGDTIDLVLHLENRKLLPLAWLEAADEISAAIAPEDLDAPPGPSPGTVHLINVSSLLWYRRYVRRFRLLCRRRGYYMLGPATLTSGDPFGFYTRRKVDPKAHHVIVYPRVFDLSGNTLPSRFPLGDAKTATRLFEDPTRTIGLREYTRDVPFKRIHWKASARHNEFQVKIFEPTTTLEVVVGLDADGFIEGDDFELAVSLAASLARHVIEIGHPAGLLSNAVPADRGDGGTVLPISAGPDHLMGIFEALAKATAAAAHPFDGFFSDHLGRVPWGATFCIVTAGLTAATNARLETLRAEGYQGVVYEVGAKAASYGDVPSIPVRGPEDLGPVVDWRNR